MRDSIVAIPVKDEAERIGACLKALAGQGHLQVLLLLNNCHDNTEATVRALAPSLPIPIHIESRNFPPEKSNAGHARRAALQAAERHLGADGILMTTDADSRVAPDWLAANLAALHRGADLVAGRAIIDPVEARAIPAHLHDDDARECTYANLLDEIDALIDPDPHDPWPRHTEHSGASLAVTLEAYRRAGGIPAIPLGEDRAFVDALRRIDARIRHAPEVTVTVSGRLEGRAAGGMADTMRRRTVAQDPHLDDRLEPARDHLRRARLRARFRTAWHHKYRDPALANHLGIAPAEFATMLAQTYCGAGWELAEQASPLLRTRHPVARTDLRRETAQAVAIRDHLRALTPARHRSEIVAPAAAILA